MMLFVHLVFIFLITSIFYWLGFRRGAVVKQEFLRNFEDMIICKERLSDIGFEGAENMTSEEIRNAIDIAVDNGTLVSIEQAREMLFEDELEEYYEDIYLENDEDWQDKLLLD